MDDELVMRGVIWRMMRGVKIRVLTLSCDESGDGRCDERASISWVPCQLSSAVHCTMLMGLLWYKNSTPFYCTEPHVANTVPFPVQCPKEWPTGPTGPTGATVMQMWGVWGILGPVELILWG